jgi:hypothetical protein
VKIVSCFMITGPGFYRARGGQKAEVVTRAGVFYVGDSAHFKYWRGVIDKHVVTWWPDGRENSARPSAFDLIYTWQEVAK